LHALHLSSRERFIPPKKRGCILGLPSQRKARGRREIFVLIPPLLGGINISLGKTKGFFAREIRCRRLRKPKTTLPQKRVIH
jgi:hypothetical protein